MPVDTFTPDTGRYDADELYRLLPQIYRIRDAQQGGALAALVAVLAREAAVVEADVARLYDNWFIETCDEWVVPYIADLLGVRGLSRVSPQGTSARARVANTLAYRRRKGTATMLEQLARDTTGWPAHAVEFFQRLATTQYLNHLRAHNLRTPDLRDANALELLGGAFETAAHTAEVRRIAPGRGRYNIPNVGLFLWRLGAYPVAQANPGVVAASPDGRYTFSPLKNDAPLFNVPQTEREITHLATELNVPAQLRRRPLYDELEARRQAIADGVDYATGYFDADPPLRVFVRMKASDALSEIAPEAILICDLSDPPTPIPDGWRRPPNAKVYTRQDGTTRNLPIGVAADPVLGRLAFAAGAKPFEVRVSYAYGFGGDVGGGPYDRQDAVAAHFLKQTFGKTSGSAAEKRDITWRAGVSRAKAAVAGELVFATLKEAVIAWNKLPASQRQVGFITMMDSLSYDESLTGTAAIKMPPGTLLVIAAADWPVVKDANGNDTRPADLFAAEEVRPHVRGNWEVKGDTVGAGQVGGELAIDGLLMEGSLAVKKGDLGALTLAHSTLVPGRGGISVAAPNASLRLNLTRSICAGIACSAEGAEVSIVESIIDAPASVAISAAKARVSLAGATVFGGIKARFFDADTSIVTEKVAIERRQTGCARFCFITDDSDTPRRYRCQPDLALKDIANAQKAAVRARVFPQFAALKYGNPAYAQLATVCAPEIGRGAEDGNEMGAFHFLQNAARENALLASLDEYLRFGLEAGIIYAT